MCVASPASHSTVREGLNLPVWSWRDYGMLLYSARALPEGLHTEACPCERGRVQVCSVNRVLQHCARGIEPASGVGGTTAAMFSARALREGMCASAIEGIYMCVASPAFHSTGWQSITVEGCGLCVCCCDYTLCDIEGQPRSTGGTLPVLSNGAKVPSGSR